MTTHNPTSEGIPIRSEAVKGKSEKPVSWFSTKAGKIIVRTVSGVAGVAAAGGAIAYAISPKGGEPAPAPVTTNSAEPFPTEEPTSEATPNNTEKPNEYWVSPEELAAMSPQELQEFATITVEEAPELEGFAKEFVKVLQARLNAGGSAEEFAPYENAPTSEYEQAMLDKYDPIFDAGLLGDGLQSEGWRDMHKIAINSHWASFAVNDPVRYALSVDLVGVTILEHDQSSGSFSIAVDVVFRDNYQELKANEYVHKPKLENSVTYTINGQVQSNGEYKSPDIT